MIPSVTATLTPGIGLTAAWAIGTSKNTPRLAPNGRDGQGRYLAAGERYCIIWPVYAPTGDANLCFNLHDVPMPDHDWGSISPVHVEWWQSTKSWHVHREYGGQKDIACPEQKPGVLAVLGLDLTVDLVAGNCVVYWNGVEVGSFGKGPTLNPGRGENDLTFAPFLQSWIGAYQSVGISSPAACTSGLGMFSPNGGTFADALADTPTFLKPQIPDGHSSITLGEPFSPAMIAALWGAAPPVDRFAAARVKVEKFRKASPNIAAAFDETFKALS